MHVSEDLLCAEGVGCWSWEGGGVKEKRAEWRPRLQRGDGVLSPGDVCVPSPVVAILATLTPCTQFRKRQLS
jgi:hypothetical protein